jgi:primosomal protein N' (replication factor Y) (superfamily II helicase)
MSSGAQVGSRVLASLGRKLITGYIVALRDKIPADSSLKESDIKDAKELLDVVPLITPEVLEITRWISNYYAAPLGEVIKAALPPGISPATERFFSITPEGEKYIGALSPLRPATIKARVLRLVADKREVSLNTLGKAVGKNPAANAARALERQGLIKSAQHPVGVATRAKHRRVVRLSSGLRTDSTEIPKRKLTDSQQRVIQRLTKGGTLPLQELLAAVNVGTSTVSTLQKRGLIEVFDEQVRRDPLERAVVPQVEEYRLTEAQAQVLREIEGPLSKAAYSTFLLHGITGSGKTEVYIRAMRTALRLGRSILMLVPEIALTPVFSRRLRAHFGDQVAIFHSSLSKGERFDEWTRVRNGAARVVIGTRSGVFAPISNLGLVIVDEEHESTYRQQDSPYYNGRDTAIVRAQKANAVVVLGSATPSLETFHNARTGKYRYLHLPKRIANRPLAAARIIDMRDVFAHHGRPRVFSDELLEAIEKTHSRKEQSIILLNRRGYSSFILCRSCGETIQCPNCDVTLTYHRSERVIICHYCNHREAAPKQCPACEGKYIYYVGEGTQRIEELLKEFFPTLKIARIDRDTSSHRSLFESALLAFSEGKLDMLVGTQLLAKGHDFPNVTLVGVVSVDAGLALPDFRAAERSFQLITQVAGRAGRGDRPGHVLIQTHHPNHYALRHACAQDYSGFYNEEIRYRQNHSYPPFVVLASLLVHGQDLSRVRAAAVTLRRELDLANNDRGCRILGPAPAPLSRLKGEYRIQLLIKSRDRRRLRAVADRALTAVVSKGVNPRSINFEVDPISML